MFQKENQYSKGIRRIPSRFNYPRCRGRYIAICEGDYYWTDPLQLQKQVDFLETNDDYVMTYHDTNVVDQNGIILQQEPIHLRHKRDASSEDLILGRRVPMTLTLCLRNVIKEFPPEMRLHHIYFLFISNDQGFTSWRSRFSSLRFRNQFHVNGNWVQYIHCGEKPLLCWVCIDP